MNNFQKFASLEQLTYQELRLSIDMVADRLVQGIVPPEPLTNAQACGLIVPSAQAEQRWRFHLLIFTSHRLHPIAYVILVMSSYAKCMSLGPLPFDILLGELPQSLLPEIIAEKRSIRVRPHQGRQQKMDPDLQGALVLQDASEGIVVAGLDGDAQCQGALGVLQALLPRCHCSRMCC